MSIHKTFHLGRVFGCHPTCGFERRVFKTDFDFIFTLDAGGQHLKLQTTDDSDDPVRTKLRLEDLRHAFFGKALQCAAHVFGFHRIIEAHTLQNFRREVGNTGEGHFFAFGQCVAYANGAVIGNADDVAREGFIHHFAVLRKKECRVMNAYGLAAAGHAQTHTALEAA